MKAWGGVRGCWIKSVRMANKLPAMECARITVGSTDIWVVTSCDGRMCYSDTRPIKYEDACPNRGLNIAKPTKLEIFNASVGKDGLFEPIGDALIYVSPSSTDIASIALSGGSLLSITRKQMQQNCKDRLSKKCILETFVKMSYQEAGASRQIESLQKRVADDPNGPVAQKMFETVYSASTSGHLAFYFNESSARKMPTTQEQGSLGLSIDRSLQVKGLKSCY